MRKIFSLLVILVIIIVGCDKEEPESPLSARVVKEVQIAEETEEIGEEEIISIRLCHDTDNGMVKWVNGTVFGFYHNAERFEFNDYCFNNDILIEYYCEDERPHNMTFVCEHGCADNHCQ